MMWHSYCIKCQTTDPVIIKGKCSVCESLKQQSPLAEHHVEARKASKLFIDCLVERLDKADKELEALSIRVDELTEFCNKIKITP